MKLYNNDLSPFCARVRYVIYSRALPVTIEAPPRDFKALSPMSKVPALHVEDYVINESEAINEFFQDAFTSPVMRRLLPADPFRRAHARSVVRMNDLYLQMQLYDLIRAKVGALQGSPLLNGVNRVLDAIEAGFVGPFTAGNDQSLADIALVVSLMTGLEPLRARHSLDLLANRPKLAAMYERQMRDPDWKRVFGEYNTAVDNMRKARANTSANAKL